MNLTSPSSPDYVNAYRKRMRQILQESLSEYMEEPKGLVLMRDELLSVAEEELKYYQEKINQLNWLCRCLNTNDE